MAPHMGPWLLIWGQIKDFLIGLSHMRQSPDIAALVCGSATSFVLEPTSVIWANYYGELKRGHPSF